MECPNCGGELKKDQQNPDMDLCERCGWHGYEGKEIKF